MNLSSVDLNLLVALDALLREKNVTRAAERVHLTQSTLSAALARLRRVFDDELLYRTGNKLELTPLALRLAPMVADAIVSAESVFAVGKDRETRLSTRRFRIAASDYGILAVGPLLINALARVAPRATVEFVRLGAAESEPFDVRLREVDGVLAPHGVLPEDFPHADLLHDEWVIAADAAHPLAQVEAPTWDEVMAYPWVLSSGNSRMTPAGLRTSEWVRIETNARVTVSGFAAVPACIHGSDRLGLVQRRTVEAVDPEARLALLRPPFDTAPIVEAFWWHPLADRDPDHEMLRGLLAGVTSAVASEVPPR